MNASVYILKSKGFDNLHGIYLKTELHNFQTFLAHLDLASYEERLRGRLTLTRTTSEADSSPVVFIQEMYGAARAHGNGENESVLQLRALPCAT